MLHCGVEDEPKSGSPCASPTPRSTRSALGGDEDDDAPGLFASPPRETPGGPVARPARGSDRIGHPARRGLRPGRPVGSKITTARHTARMPRIFDDAANCFLERVYVDRFCASVGLSSTYGISIFVWVLALCRVVEKLQWPQRRLETAKFLSYPLAQLHERHRRPTPTIQRATPCLIAGQRIPTSHSGNSMSSTGTAPRLRAQDVYLRSSLSPLLHPRRPRPTRLQAEPLPRSPLPRARPRPRAPRSNRPSPCPAGAIAWDVFCWIGHRRFSRHWVDPPDPGRTCTTPLPSTSSENAIANYIHRYQAMLAARQQDFEALRRHYHGRRLDPPLDRRPATRERTRDALRRPRTDPASASGSPRP